MPARSRSTSRRAAGLGREAALYFRLAGIAPGAVNADDRTAAAAFAEGIDWDAFRRIARHDGTTAAIHRRLVATGATPPADVAEALAREARVLDFHQLRLERALAEALGLLAGAGLRPVLLKGAAVARVAYGRAADRPMSDADLLLAPAEAAAAMQVLQAAGWQATTDDAGAARYGGHHHLVPLAAPDGSGSLLEVHRDVLPAGHPFAWDGAGVRARARPAGAGAAGSGGALVPDAADLLLHAGVHFAWAHELRHGAWRAIADVAALLVARGPGGALLVDAAEVVRRAERARAASAVGWTLHVAATLGGVPVPAGLRALLPDGAAMRSLTAAVAAELEPAGRRAPAVAVGRLAWERAIRPGASGHGAARPWLTGAAGAGVATGKSPRAGGPRALAQARRAGRWARWLWRVLGR